MLVSIYIYVYMFVDQKNLNRTCDRLTFSNIHGIALLSPETLSSLSKLRIFLFNAHLATDYGGSPYAKKDACNMHVTCI